MGEDLDLLTVDGFPFDIAHQKLESGKPRAVVGIHAAVVTDGGGSEGVLECGDYPLGGEFRVEVFGKFRDALDRGGVHKGKAVCGYVLRGEVEGQGRVGGRIRPVSPA